MLTRLRVQGFKNLADVDVRFGPFTCVAGANGIGKSNLFDAVRFLARTSDLPLAEAARSVRGGVESLFQRVGGHDGQRISFEAEMIVPQKVEDDLGQPAEATITFLSYRLVLARRATGEAGPLEIVAEELRHIPRGDAPRHLLFPHSAGRWRSSAITGERRAPYFISTAGDGPGRTIQLHQDGGARGGPLKLAAPALPRTVLSGATAAESPTALAARRELRGWRILQLEPSALRRADSLAAPGRLGADGSHLAAVLHRLARAEVDSGERLFEHLAERLGELVDDVAALRLHHDEARDRITLQVVDKDGTAHPAPALSDGSLRFLALAVLELDPRSGGLICLEEPENGVHPERIPAMLQLLQDLAVDVRRPLGGENPLRQVIVNTHSPAVVTQVPAASLLVALGGGGERPGLGRFRAVELHPLPDTWRAKAPGSLTSVALDELLAFLHPAAAWERGRRRRSGRVVDRDDVRQLFIPFDGASDPGS
jgi:predicted ATPase